jgi:hypothetical protein
VRADETSPQKLPQDGNDQPTTRPAWVAPQIEIVAAGDAENSPFVPGATFDGGSGYS